MGDDKDDLSFVPLLYSDIVKECQEHAEKQMKEMSFSTIASPEAMERMREFIGCPDDIDPVEHLRGPVKRSPDIPYGVPRWMSAVVGRYQGTQDTTEKKEPTQSLSGPLERIRESLKKGQD